MVDKPNTWGRCELPQRGPRERAAEHARFRLISAEVEIAVTRWPAPCHSPVHEDIADSQCPYDMHDVRAHSLGEENRPHLPPADRVLLPVSGERIRVDRVHAEALVHPEVLTRPLGRANHIRL